VKKWWSFLWINMATN